MTAATALLDSNVVVAMLAQAHEHHALSLPLLTDHDPASFAIASHSYAEAYATLTRASPINSFRFQPDEAWAALAGLRGITTLVGLTPIQGVDAVCNYARSGGIGARLYDALIGEVALVVGLAAIVTWNTRHMAGLFPTLRVVTPTDFLAATT